MKVLRPLIPSGLAIVLTSCAGHRAGQTTGPVTPAPIKLPSTWANQTLGSMETVTPGWGSPAQTAPAPSGDRAWQEPPVVHPSPPPPHAGQPNPNFHPERVVISRPPALPRAPAPVAQNPVATPSPSTVAMPSPPPSSTGPAVASVVPDTSTRPSGTNEVPTFVSPPAAPTAAGLVAKGPAAADVAHPTKPESAVPAVRPPSASEGTGAAPGVQTQTAKGPEPIRELSALASSEHPESLMQRPVELSGLRVDEVLGSYFFAVRMPDGTPMLVGSPEALTDVQAGDRVDVTGGVRKVPEGAEKLALGERLTALLKARPFYIQARRIEKSDAHR